MAEGRCRDCIDWAAYTGDRGHCVAAESDWSATLHRAVAAVGPGELGPFGVVANHAEVAPGVFARGVLITTAEFGCVSFRRRAKSL